MNDIGGWVVDGGEKRESENVRCVCDGGFFYATKVQNHTQLGEETITTAKQDERRNARRSRVSRENPRDQGDFCLQ